MAERHHAICPLCDAICGIEVEVANGTITRIRGDQADPFSGGYICPKAAALVDVHDDPDRVRQPLKRVGTRFEPADWDEALDAVARGLAAAQRDHGRDAVALYIGNPTAHSYAALLYGALFHASLGTKNLYTSSSVDTLPRLYTSTLLYGNQTTIPVPDLDRAHFLLVLGANPAVSNGCTMTAPDVKRRLAAIRARGGRIVVIDPRRSETAALADAHHFIRPGTDAVLLAAMIRTVLEEDLARPGRLAASVDGLDALRAAVEPFAPETCGPVTGITGDIVRGLARDFAAAPAAVAYGRMGTTVQAFGTVASWLVDALNLVTGNLDRPGGAMFASPAVDLGRLARVLGFAGKHGRWHSRVGGFPEHNGELPVAALADEIETPGRGQIRALVTHAGNPVVSLPNGRRLDRALAGLDLYVAIDLYVNESTRHAHWILPPSFALEHDHYPILFHALGVRNTAHYAPPALAAPPGVRHDYRIFAELMERMGRERGGLAGGVRRLQARALARLGPKRLLAALLRLGGKVRLADLEAAPHGVDLGPLEPRLPALLDTPGKRLRIAPAPLLTDLARLAAALDRPPPGLLLVGRRHLRSNNSWMHNSHRLIKGPERCTLLMHPDDARARGLAAGTTVTIRSAVGAVDAPLALSDEMMPGVVSLPHGFGHGRSGVALRVASAHPGVSVNDITDERRVDAVTGASVLNGVPVEVLPRT